MLERLFEIVENKRYDHAEFTIRNIDNCFLKCHCIEIYTKDNAFIRIIKDWFIEGGLFKGHRVDYFNIRFFVPNKDTAIDSCHIRSDQDKIMYEKLYNLFYKVKQDIKDDAMDKYF